MHEIQQLRKALGSRVIDVADLVDVVLLLLVPPCVLHTQLVPAEDKMLYAQIQLSGALFMVGACLVPLPFLLKLGLSDSSMAGLVHLLQEKNEVYKYHQYGNI